MNETSSDIRDDIVLERDELGHDIHALKDTAQDDVRQFATKVRRFVEEQPMTAIAIAAGAGIVLSGFLTDDAHGDEPPERREVSDTLANIKDALMAVAKKESKTLLQNARSGS
jgi:hypothetical protein